MSAQAQIQACPHPWEIKTADGRCLLCAATRGRRHHLPLSAQPAKWGTDWRRGGKGRRG